MSTSQRLSEEESARLEELVGRVLTRGDIELEIEIEIMDTKFVFLMPDQQQTEDAMDEAGKDHRGYIRDVLSREIIFTRFIMAKAIVYIDEHEVNESLNRRLLAKMPPAVVQALFTRFAAERESQKLRVFRAVGLTKKLPPNSGTEQNGNSPEPQGT